MDKEMSRIYFDLMTDKGLKTTFKLVKEQIDYRKKHGLWKED